MATTASLRIRRSAAQRHALEGVEEEIRSSDHYADRKYLQDFVQAFRSYDSVIPLNELKAVVHGADILLVGDYHALPASQHFAATLLEQRAYPGDRPIVLGVETIFARDQHILDQWWRREIAEDELRERIRFDLDWGYDWPPSYSLLVAAREHAEAIYALDCTPRNDLRGIGARDRHAVHKIAEIRQRHPDAVILVLFGESHFAPNHMPRLLAERLPNERTLTVLQNVDALYWRAAGEQHEQVDAVQVVEDVVCVFNATPLEKYENYRVHLARWNQEELEAPDLGPTIYNLIDGLVRFLGINRYSSRNGKQPKFLVDMMPEVYCVTSEARLQALLSRRGVSKEEIATILERVEERGSIYIAEVNAFYVRDLQMMYAGEEAARFLHHACQGLPRCKDAQDATFLADIFYTRALEHAVGYFGSRLLYPARPAARNIEPEEFSRSACQQFLSGVTCADAEFTSLTQRLGYALGSELYDAYLAGNLKPARLRRLLLHHLNEPGAAAEVFWSLTKLRTPHRKPPRSVQAGDIDSNLVAG